MGLDSLLTSLNRGVAGVADVQPLQHKAFARNGRESADVAGVAAAMPGADSATAATAHKSGDVTRKPLQHKACTPATAATAEKIEVRSEAAKVGAATPAAEPIDREAWEERAAIAEYDGGLIRADAEALAWREDDRRRCRQCLNLKGEACSIAKPGGLVSASKGYRPAHLPMRCAGFSPSHRDKDQRAGAEVFKGFRRGMFDEAFSRYLVSTPIPSVTPLQPSDGAGLRVTDDPQRYGNETQSETRKPVQHKACNGVTDTSGVSGEVIEVEV